MVKAAQKDFYYAVDGKEFTDLKVAEAYEAEVFVDWLMILHGEKFEVHGYSTRDRVRGVLVELYTKKMIYFDEGKIIEELQKKGRKITEQAYGWKVHDEA